MTDDTGHGSERKDGSPPSSEEAALSARLESLEQRLSQSRASRKTQADQSGTGSENAQARASAFARGFQLSSELVVGVVAGAAIGWGFDRLLSTSPFGLIVFFLLGFIAGLINLIRSAGRGS
ncbi:MAG TPA: AtpZ/AtpI family protein [Rhodopseudomonas sp.]|uniref:AtpZ/AtpI family protein n=1 Tax=Rhodopseudomonas sp. TaxID=1078 RepID=UPI002EDA6F81